MSVQLVFTLVEMSDKKTVVQDRRAAYVAHGQPNFSFGFPPIEYSKRYIWATLSLKKYKKGLFTSFVEKRKQKELQFLQAKLNRINSL